MELSKLEIKGFKSFGDKVTINFDAGITGIVGPNGCGKSNVVDAIRWVLGEQKQRNLRSDKMENIIFNGTKNRKQSQMAEVSLTLNNTKNLLPTEYSEVMITRKYYRSGDSEYQINGVTCRLKDITNLFLDTGIGSDSYAIIELKMVDDILNDKNDSRRALFEEAAGISKFKVRKKQTLSKLKSTDEDLERVEDLLFEIEKNLKSLEKQAKQADKYIILKEDYKGYSIELAKVKTESQNTSLNTLNKQLEGNKTEKTSVQKQIAEKDAEIEKIKKDLIIKEKLLASRQKALNEHVEKIRKIEGDTKIKNERLRFLTDKKVSLTAHLNTDKEARIELEKALSLLKNEITAAQKNVTEKKKEVDKLKSSYEEQKSQTTFKQEELTQTSSSYNIKKDELFQVKKDIELKELQITTLKNELEKQQTDTSQHEESLLEFDAKIKLIENNYKSKEANLTKLSEAENKLQKELLALNDQRDGLKEEVTKLNRTLDAKQNEFELTKSLVDNLEGFPEAIKFLKKNKGWKMETPLLSDILACSEEYRTCVENFLETNLNYFVVDNDADAIKAINLLSESNRGKGHFFVLDKFNEVDNFPTKSYENAIPALEIITIEDKFKTLAQNLLNKVYIIMNDNEDFPEATDGEIFLTKNGKIIKRKQSFSGGSVGLFEGKRIGRAKNLDILSEDIKELTKSLTKKKSALSQVLQKLDKYNDNSKNEEIDKLREDFHSVREEYVALKTKKEQFESLIKSSSTRKEEVFEKLHSLQEELEKSTPNLPNQEIEINELKEKFEILSEAIGSINESLALKSSQFNNENIVFHQLESKLNSITQDITYKEQNLAQVVERIDNSSRDLKACEVESRKILENQDTSEGSLLGLYDEKESMSLGLNEAEKDYYNSRGSVDTLETDRRTLQNKKETNDEFSLEIQNKLNDLKLDLNAVKERLSVEFDVNLSQVLAEERTNDLSGEQLEIEVEKVKIKLERMGPINPMAKEAYDEIKERHMFIIEQRTDLFKAKESLLNTITEIDEVAKETFSASFIEVRENFINVFRSLFTEEDSCDLKLANPDDPLDSEILITAKPKGKRPLTINQLSGGEKTLTAVALLFAIYLLKPAPFCIFDEVDAPLDDANIDKFNKIIRKFSADSQFIIVTHNKRTMVSTDIIYGVTMLEQGVSRVIPVDLRSLK